MLVIADPLPAKGAEIPAIIGSARIGPAEHLVKPVLNESFPVRVAVIFLCLAQFLAKALPLLGKVDVEEHPRRFLPRSASGAEYNRIGNVPLAALLAVLELSEEQFFGDLHLSS